MNTTKLQLSEKELDLVQNADWLLTKNIIIEKAYHLFGEIAHEIQSIFNKKKHLFPELLLQSPKISKGENYRGLPYVMLDYPRCFGKEDTFAIRTMFWWGNFFSTTLHLKGKYKYHFADSIRKNFKTLLFHDFYISVGTDEWSHVFEPQNYAPLRHMEDKSVENILDNSLFVKISAKIILRQWNEAKELLMNYYRIILEVLNINFPNDETNL